MANLANCEFSELEIYCYGQFSITNGDLNQIKFNPIQSSSIKSNSSKAKQLNQIKLNRLAGAYRLNRVQASSSQWSF